MLPMQLFGSLHPLKVLCLGAHSDDIEIGCSGAVRWLAERASSVTVVWSVLGASDPRRATEAHGSASAWLSGTADFHLDLASFPDGRFPVAYGAIKDHLAGLQRRMEFDVVFTHALSDRHQDHRLVAEMTWQIWRNQLILEYEIPKFDGDLGQPNLYVALSDRIAEAKVTHLMQHFSSQRSRDWFDADTFRALMRLRGIECRAPERQAEAFYARKLVA